MGYFGTGRLESDSALDLIWEIEDHLVERCKRVYDLGEAFGIADIVIKSDEIGKHTESVADGGIVRILISGLIENLQYTADEFVPTVHQTISELIAKVVAWDIQIAKADAEARRLFANQ